MAKTTSELKLGGGASSGGIGLTVCYLEICLHVSAIELNLILVIAEGFVFIVLILAIAEGFVLNICVTRCGS